jgi:hypothetical protein
MAMRALDSFMPKQRERRDGGGGGRVTVTNGRGGSMGLDARAGQRRRGHMRSGRTCSQRARHEAGRVEQREEG